MIHASRSRLTQSLQVFFQPSWNSLDSRLEIHITVAARESLCARYFAGTKKEAVPVVIWRGELNDRNQATFSVLVGDSGKYVS